MRTTMLAAMVGLVPLLAAAQADPAYWQIMGVGGGLREQPFAGATAGAQPPTGTVVRNLGCETSRGRSWCEVELLDQPGVRGWVGATNLLAAEDPAAD
jgi:hypothetical protein